MTNDTVVSTRRRISPITSFSNLYNKRYETYVLNSLKAELFGLTIPITEEFAWIKEMGEDRAAILSVKDGLKNNAINLGGKYWVVNTNGYNFIVANLEKEPNIEKVGIDKIILIFDNLLKSFMLDGDLESLLSLIHYIHYRLNYFTTRSSLFVEYYQEELYNAYASYIVQNLAISKYEENILKLNKDKLEKTTDLLTRNIVNTVKVWLMRELYYMVSPLSDLSNSDQLFLFKCLYFGKKEQFWNKISTLSEDRRDRSFGCTNPNIYFDVIKNFKAALLLPKQAMFNAILNIAHCNGSMSSKFIKLPADADYSENEFLTNLSNGKYTTDVKRCVSRDLDISPLLF